MRYFIALIILISFSIKSFSQGVFSDTKDTVLKSKMEEYMAMIKKADVYQSIVETQISIVSLYKKEGRRYYDSAYVGFYIVWSVGGIGDTDSDFIEFFLTFLNIKG